jgi:EmrB/QacA subfamily drug resistance transporter
VTTPAPGTQQETNKWWTLVAVCVATFMLLIDVTIVNVALPDIARALGSSFTDLQWVIDAYALGLAALLLTWGSTSDRVGRRRIFVVGLVIFTLASLACALSPSPLALDVARAVQGVGGAAMFATSLALLAAAFHGAERGTAVGIWGATIGAAVAIGPLVGGILTEAIGWEAIFYINVPIGIGAIYLALTKVGESRDPNAGPNDWAGLVTFSGGLFLLIFALVRGNAEGWGSTLIVSFLVGAAVLLVAFVVIEARIAHPMFDLALFRKPAFSGACVAAFALSAAFFSMFLYLTLYMQNALYFSPLETGVRFLPLSLVSFFVAPLAGRLSARIPVRILIGGGLALVAGALMLMRGLDASSGWTALLAGFIVGGIGVGLVNAPLGSVAVSVVPPARTGMGSGINSTFRQLGIATGTAGLGALFQHLLTDRATGPLARVPAEVLAQGNAPRAPAAAHDAFLSLFTGAMNDLFLVGAIVAFVGAVLSFALLRPRDFAPAGAGARPEAAGEPVGV